jgi:Mn-dependent DtxR family transcriptional regulator
MRKLRKLPDDYLEQIFDLLQKSYSLKEISKEFGVTYEHLKRIMSRLYTQYEVKNIYGLISKKDQVILENSRKHF